MLAIPAITVFLPIKLLVERNNKGGGSDEKELVEKSNNRFNGFSDEWDKLCAGEWDELFTDLDNGEADAAIASIRISEESLDKADFTERYYATPARFIAKKDNALKDIIPETLAEKKIGVVKDTGHEAYLKQFFPGATLVEFDSADAAQAALKKGDVEFMFGDGIGLTFWLNGVTSDGCCEFRGGPYIDAKFFGEGVGIAVRKGNRELTEILDYALEQVHASGRYEELFLRYFPMSFF